MGEGKYSLAEPLYQRALAICDQQLVSEHPDTAASLNNLAALCDAKGKYEQAEHLFKRVLAIREKQFGSEHPNTVAVRENNNTLFRKIKRKMERQH